MDVLAKEAGVARATVYEHFRSKRAVLDELASTAAAVRDARSDRARADVDPLAGPARHARRGVPALGRKRGDDARAAHARGDDGWRRGRRRDRSGLAAQARRGARRAAASSARTGTVDDAVDALAVLTSYPTYERLAAPTNGAHARAGRGAAREARRSRSSRPGSRDPARASRATTAGRRSRASSMPTTVWWMIRAVVSTRSARLMPIGSRSRWNAAMRSISATSAAPRPRRRHRAGDHAPRRARRCDLRPEPRTMNSTSVAVADLAEARVALLRREVARAQHGAVAIPVGRRNRRRVRGLRRARRRRPTARRGGGRAARSRHRPRPRARARASSTSRKYW